MNQFMQLFVTCLLAFYALVGVAQEAPLEARSKTANSLRDFLSAKLEPINVENIHPRVFNRLMSEDRDGDNNLVNFYKKVSPSLWLVIVMDQKDHQLMVYSMGTAVAISQNVLLTNCHVVMPPKQFQNQKIFIRNEKLVSQEVKLLSSDPKSDRCMLKTDRMSLAPVIGIRSTDSVQVGERVFSIGNPPGFQLALSDGLLSSIKTGKGGRRLFLTTAPISHGSSGGGLFDMQGALIGVTSAVITNTPNFGIAIPAEDFIFP